MPAGPSRTLNGPTFIVATSGGTNIPAVGGSALNSPAANTYWLLKHIHLFNTDVSARTVSLYKDATGTSTAGKDFVSGVSIAANTAYDVYFPAGDKWTTADFMSGYASVASKVSIEYFGEAHAA